MPYKSPQAVVEMVCDAGSAKASLPIAKQLALGVLAGAYLGLGGLLSLVVGGGSSALTQTNPGLAQLTWGAVFPLGFLLVLIAGGELFTMNCGVIVPACLARAARWRALLVNWGLVYLGNLIGALLVALGLAYGSGLVSGGELGKVAAALAEAKTVRLDWGQAFLRGIGGNWLACLAVWLAVAAEDIPGKVLGLWFPSMAFVALGLEHMVANMFFIPLGMLNGAQVTILNFVWLNLVPVTLGNILGGSLLVGGLYWWVYGRD